MGRDAHTVGLRINLYQDRMALLSPPDAAKLARKDIRGIYRRMRTGAMSYSVDERGKRRIDTSELVRIWPEVGARLVPANNEAGLTSNTFLPGPDPEAHRVKEQLIATLIAQVEDLQQRLTVSEEERRAAQALYTRVIEHHTREHVIPMNGNASRPQASRGWFSRWKPKPPDAD